MTAARPPRPARIRRARPDEAAALTELAVRSKAAWGYDAEQMRVFAAELELPPAQVEGHPAYVAERDGELLGFYSLLPLGAGELDLEHLFIAPEALRQGLGKRLLDHALSCAREQGARALRIVADPHAAEFYRRCGAQDAGAIESSIPGRKLPVLRFAWDPS